MSDSLSQQKKFNLSVEERLELLKKLDNLQYFNRLEEVNDLFPIEIQEKFFSNFKLSFFDTIAAFLRQIIYGENFREYILKRAIKNEIYYLSHLNPPIIDKNGTFVLEPLIKFLYDAGKISTDYSEFFKFWKKTISSKNNLVSFALYYFDKIKNNDNKSYFELFHEKNLVQLIETTKEYKKIINDNILIIRKHIKSNIEKFAIQINKMYNFIIFFTYDYSGLFNILYPVRFNNFTIDFYENQFSNIHIDKFVNAIRPLSRLFMVYPYYNEFSEDDIKFFLQYYNEIYEEHQIDINVFYRIMQEFTEQIQYYAAKNIVNRLYKVIYKNPLLEVPFFSLTLDIKSTLEKQIEQALDEKVKEAEAIVEKKLFEEFYKLLKEEGADKVKPLDANENLLSFLNRFELPSLNYLNSYLVFYSFYKVIWLSKLSQKISHITEFKYYNFNQQDLKNIKDLLESINQIITDLELIDKLANGIKIEMMKLEKKLPSKEDIVKLSLLVSNLDSKMKNILISVTNNLSKLKNLFNLDTSDPEILFIKLQLNKFIDVFQRICPYDR